MHVELGGYHVGDIEVVAAFDVDATKVGQDVGKAIWAGQNNTIKFANVGDLGVVVHARPDLGRPRPVLPGDDRGITCAGRGRGRGAWPRPKADVLVSYLPVGSEVAQKHYAQACLDAKVAFVNAIPVFIASDPVWAAKFTEAGVPIIGDDIKSQLGSTIAHRVLARLFEDRGLSSTVRTS